MSEPNGPALDDLGKRHFSFYPAILNIEHNEWRLLRAAWSEILVVNAKTGQEVWIPRRLVGEVVRVDEPVMIIGLRKELEYKAGAVWPRERRLLAMTRMGGRPQALDKAPDGRSSGGGLGRTPAAEAKISRLIGGAVLLAISLLVVAVVVMNRPVSYKGMEQLALQLNGNDDYSSIVRKLGPPSDDHWRPEAGEALQYRALRFKGEPYTLVLMGMDRDSARYIGALDKDWKAIHSVRLPSGGDTLAILRTVPKF
jgi:hypothetical protein